MSDTKISSDRPVNSLEADRYGLKDHFVPRLARIALEWPSEDGLVIGLYGSWGIGKTSVLNMFRDFVKKEHRYSNVRIASFNPWFYEDTGALVTSFFATIAAEFGESQDGPLKHAANAFKAIGTFLTVASKGVSLFGINMDAAVVGEAMEAGTKVLKETGELSTGLAGIAELAHGGHKKLEEHRATVEKALRSLGESDGRVVVLIDDVDRLDKAELLSLLRLVRTVADLSYTTLVLAMDDERIRDILVKAASEGYGKGYLDKIVQVPLHIPLPTREKMTSELAEQLKTTLQKAGHELPPELTPYSFGPPTELQLLASLVRTPRDLSRYLNGVRTLLLSGEDPDIHPTDAALVEALHIFHPDVYDRVRRHKDFLTESPSRSLSTTFNTRDNEEQERIRRSKELDTIIHGSTTTLNASSEKTVRALLNQLFDDVTNPNLVRAHKSDTEQRRIRSTTTFDNYFRCAPPPEMVKRSELNACVERLLNQARDKDIDGISTTLADAFTGRSDQATKLLLQDIGQKLLPLDPERINAIGEGVLSTVARLPPDLIIRLLVEVLEAILEFRSNHEEWTEESASAQALKLLQPAVRERFPLAHSCELLSWLNDKNLENSRNRDDLRNIHATWVERVDRELSEGDLFGSADAKRIFLVAWTMIRDLGKDSPVSQETFSAHLTEYVLRRPERLPQALLLASSPINPQALLLASSPIKDIDIPVLTNSSQPKEKAIQSLRDVFGNPERLRPALEEFRERKLDAGRYSRLLEDFGELLK